MARWLAMEPVRWLAMEPVSLGKMARDGAGKMARDGAGKMARDGAGKMARDGAVLVVADLMVPGVDFATTSASIVTASASNWARSLRSGGGRCARGRRSWLLVVNNAQGERCRVP
jgi:hypothetical protein